MVPLTGGQWAEVKTLDIGTVDEPDPKCGKQHTRDVSYFSRLAEAETFTRQALCKTHRRGTEMPRGSAHPRLWARGGVCGEGSPGGVWRR